MMKNQETAIALIEMEENIGCGIIFLISLAIMGKGMAGIFVVVLIITAVVLILGKLK